MKKLLRDRGLVERGFSQKGGFPNWSISFSSEKHVFITIGILFFFCLVNIHACFNQ